MPIFDQGYQHWNGTLSGHAWRWLAITRHGVRIGSRNRALRLLMIVSWSPALVLAAVLCFWGLLERKSSFISSISPFLTFLHPRIILDPRHYRREIWTLAYDAFLMIELRMAMLVVLLVGPNLISADLRFNALPLYLSRPLRRIDYFLGKLGIIFVFLSRVILLPCLIAYVLGLLFSLDITILKDTFPLLLASLTYGVIITVSAGLLILALSALSRNSRYVALFWLGIWFVSSVVGAVLQEADSSQRRQEAYRDVDTMVYPTHGSNPKEMELQRQRWMEAYAKAQERAAIAEIHRSETDWRPMVSYTANLARIGDQLIGTNRACQSMEKLLPEGQHSELLTRFMGPQCPWTWSAGVLIALIAVSTFILSSQVKSLDRLK